MSKNVHLSIEYIELHQNISTIYECLYSCVYNSDLLAIVDYFTVLLKGKSQPTQTNLLCCCKQYLLALSGNMCGDIDKRTPSSRVRIAGMENVLTIC